MSSEKIIIAIDGYSSSGKSTMARRLAKEIGYRYIDSGAMYRAVTLYAMRNSMIEADGSVITAALVEALPDIHIDFKVDGDGQLTMLNGEIVENAIRTLEVSNHVSPVAAIPAVRHALVKMQREMGKTKGIVMDGRDIGTVVFPQAEMKVFCNATPERRAERRFKELTAKGADVTYEDVLANVMERDHIDMTREESPLRCADDAVMLDNSAMTLDEQNEWLLNLYNSIIAKQK
ncbi:MAG: (d)CMP kinase [Bacteroides sp.]|nr:(d)CMP kinase [Bacteroides sp.]MBD5355221.1 (d)CMP kinase [Bacteroides sp.]MDE5825965.1 (d)CMP kinase [Duncaniella sp.]MDE6823227.1 (d)CMP kinase [Duncaniella sp.]